MLTTWQRLFLEIKGQSFRTRTSRRRTPLLEDEAVYMKCSVVEAVHSYFWCRNPLYFWDLSRLTSMFCSHHYFTRSIKKYLLFIHMHMQLSHLWLGCLRCEDSRDHAKISEDFPESPHKGSHVGFCSCSLQCTDDPPEGRRCVSDYKPVCKYKISYRVRLVLNANKTKFML